MSTHISGLTITMVIIDQLDTVLGSWTSTRVTQTFIYITFTSWADKSWRTGALKSADPI